MNGDEILAQKLEIFGAESEIQDSNQEVTTEIVEESQTQETLDDACKTSAVSASTQERLQKVDTGVKDTAVIYNKYNKNNTSLRQDFPKVTVDSINEADRCPDMIRSTDQTILNSKANAPEGIPKITVMSNDANKSSEMPVSIPESIPGITVPVMYGADKNLEVQNDTCASSEQSTGASDKNSLKPKLNLFEIKSASAKAKIDMVARIASSATKWKKMSNREKRTIATDANHQRSLENAKERMQIGIPLPLQLSMKQEAYNIVSAIADTYKKTLGKKHRLTLEAIDYLSTLKGSLALGDDDQNENGMSFIQRARQSMMKQSFSIPDSLRQDHVN